jgi:aryl-phospho-beta-D-glucosidase BglC (GH1 family)
MPSALPPRGVNLSRWFRYPAEDSERHFRNFITDADLDLIVALGVGTVRLAVAPPLDARRLSYLDEALARLTGRGLVVVLDYHDESRSLESGAAEVRAFADVWTSLAAHLARTTSPHGVLLEILNEPVFDADPRAWFPIRRRVVETIRAAAPLHTLVTGGPHWSSLDGLLMSEPVDDANVVYTFHFYEPFEFTHQGAPWVSGPVRELSGVRYPASMRDPHRIDRRIAAAAQWAARYAVPVWAGEFGAFPDVAPREDRLRWLRDVRTAFERHAIGWAVWSYDESLGLDRRVDRPGHVVIDWDSARALGLRDSRAVTA